MNQKGQNNGRIEESEPFRHTLGKKKTLGAWKENRKMGCYARQHREALSNIS